MLIPFPLDAYDAYQTATGAILDPTTGLLSITEDQLDNLDSLFFEIEGVRTISLPCAEQS